MEHAKKNIDFVNNNTPQKTEQYRHHKNKRIKIIYSLSLNRIVISIVQNIERETIISSLMLLFL